MQSPALNHILIVCEVARQDVACSNSGKDRDKYRDSEEKR